MTGGEESFPLSKLKVGAKGIVTGFAERDITPRLKELGFLGGVVLECVGENPGGGMAAYRLRGSVIALRREDAASVLVRTFAPSPDENGDGK